MKIIYLGQAGFYLEVDGKTILIDPYLSDSVAKVEPQNYRRVPIAEEFLAIKPDVIVCTHNHLDHLDKETLVHYLGADSKVVCLSPFSGWKELRQFGGSRNNYVMFNVGTEWTEGNVRFKAVKAVHSDEYAIGVIVYAEGSAYYFTGDTLYSQSVLENVGNEDLEAVFLPVNGKGNNMNFADAKRFAIAIKARHIVPIHIGLFDDLTAENWDCPNKVNPTIYQPIEL